MLFLIFYYSWMSMLNTVKGQKLEVNMYKSKQRYHSMTVREHSCILDIYNFYFYCCILSICPVSLRMPQATLYCLILALSPLNSHKPLPIYLLSNKVG